MGPLREQFLDYYETFREIDHIYPDKVIECIRYDGGTVTDLIAFYNHTVFGDEGDDRRKVMRYHLERLLYEEYGYFVPATDYLVLDLRCHIVNAIPCEMRLEVARHLDRRDLFRLALTCRRIYHELFHTFVLRGTAKLTQSSAAGALSLRFRAARGKKRSVISRLSPPQ